MRAEPLRVAPASGSGSARALGLLFLVLRVGRPGPSGAGRSGSGPARNRSTRASRWSNRCRPQGVDGYRTRADARPRSTTIAAPEMSCVRRRGRLNMRGRSSGFAILGQTTKEALQVRRRDPPCRNPPVTAPGRTSERGGLEHRERPTVEGRDPTDAKALGRRDQQRRRQAAAGARRASRSSAARARSASVGATRRIAPPDDGRTRARVASGPSSRWSSRSSSASAERAQQQRLVGPPEPGDGRGVVEVGRGRRRRARRTGRAGSPPWRSARVGPAPPASRRAIERPSSDRRPCALRPIPRNGQLGCLVVRVEIRLERPPR